MDHLQRVPAIYWVLDIGMDFIDIININLFQNVVYNSTITEVNDANIITLR